MIQPVTHDAISPRQPARPVEGKIKIFMWNDRWLRQSADCP
jgi:hypothetical protein